MQKGTKFYGWYFIRKNQNLQKFLEGEFLVEFFLLKTSVEFQLYLVT